jgi:Sugar (and other) transporter
MSAIHSSHGGHSGGPSAGVRRSPAHNRFLVKLTVISTLGGLLFGISFAFPTLVKALGASPTFGLFVLVNVGSWFFIKKFAPETRGRSLEELEDDFRTHDATHLVHEAPAGVRGG